MPTCLVLSEFSPREKEMIMLLLATADGGSWHAVRDGGNIFYIEWQLDSTHPALSFLPLTPAGVEEQEQKETLGRQQQKEWYGRAATREYGGALPLTRFVPRAHNTSPSLGKSLSFNNGHAADCSPWTIDWNTDSGFTGEQFHISNTSHPFASDYSPQTQKMHRPEQQKQQQEIARGGAMNARRQRASSQRVRGSSPSLIGRSVFLRRPSTPCQSSLSRPALLERSDSRRSSNSVASAVVSNMDVAFSNSNAVRSAQWVSRLVEDVMSYVAKMIEIDSSQIGSVASLTVTVLKARCGAFQWNKTLKELAYGLHSYHSISPLCRLFRQLFIDESSSALEDFSLFARLYRTAVKHSTLEVQKIALPHAMKGKENDDDISHSLLQYTIASRRYVELRLLRAVLTEMLAAVSIIENRTLSKQCSTGRWRKLKPAEVVGVKAVVAHWVEEESSNSDSLAFDLGGFVDLHEVIAVVVSALGSSRSLNATGNLNTMTMGKLSRGKDDVQGEVEKLQRQHEGRGGEAMSYITNSCSMVQPQGYVPEGAVHFKGKSKHVRTASPSVVSKTVRFSSRHSENSAVKSESSDSDNVRTLLRGVLREESGGSCLRAQANVKHTTVQNKPLKFLQKNNLIKEKTVLECASLPNSGKSLRSTPRREVATPTEVYTVLQQRSGAPLVVDLDSKLPAGCEQPSLNHSLLLKQSIQQDVETQRDGSEMQPLQYFAALAAVDAELQRRQEFLTSTVATDLATRENISNALVGFDELTSSAKWSTRSSIRSESQQGSTSTTVAAKLANPIESTAPPVNAGLFDDVSGPQRTMQRQTRSIKVPSGYQTQEKPARHRGEEEEGVLTPSDMDLLTDEERHLLADLRQVLGHQA